MRKVIWRLGLWGQNGRRFDYEPMAAWLQKRLRALEKHQPSDLLEEQEAARAVSHANWAKSGSGAAVHLVSDGLSRGPEQDFVDIDIVGLVHGKSDRSSKRVSADGDLADEVLRARLDVFLADVFEEFGFNRTR